MGIAQGTQFEVLIQTHGFPNSLYEMRPCEKMEVVRFTLLHFPPNHCSPIADEGGVRASGGIKKSGHLVVEL
jgi:hypothetical protein